MNRFLVLLCCLLPLQVSAYTSFDEVIETGPTWSPLPAEQVPATAAAVRYRLLVIGATRVRVEVRNPGTAPLSISVQLPDYQDAGPATTIQVAAHAEASTDITVRRVDRRCTEAAVAFTRISVGAQNVTPRPLVPPATLPGARSYAAFTTWQHPGFRPAAVAYSATANGSGIIDLRVLNRSGQAIHADAQVFTWQQAGTTMPRLHLLPGVITELLLPGTDVDARIEHATLALWNVRVGDDSGPAMGSGPEDATVFTALGDDWHPAALGVAALAGFNPDVVVWRFTANGVEIRNRGPLPVGARLSPLGEPVVPPFTIDLAPRATRLVPLPAEHGPNLLLDQPTLAGQAVLVPPLEIAAPSAQALPLRARWPDPQIAPGTVVAVVHAVDDTMGEVTFCNRSAIAWHAEWLLPGYQRGITNPRLHLAAGAALTLRVPLSQNDVRLALAQVAVWDVRLGVDEGSLRCVAPPQ
jgi:hypothetical protein